MSYKFHKKIAVLIAATLICSCIPSKFAFADAGDIINTSNKTYYKITKGDRYILDAFIEDIKNNSMNNIDLMADNFLIEDDNGLYYSSIEKSMAKKEAFVKLLVENNIDLNDKEAIRKFIDENMALIATTISEAAKTITDNPIEVDMDGYTVIGEEDIDNVRPTITLNGDNVIKLFVDEDFIDPGVTAIDNVDGDITNKVVKTITNINGEEVASIDNTKAGEFTIHYNVTDEAGNKADVVTRKVIIEEIQDTEKPTMTLNGDDVIKLYVNEDFIDPGVTAMDNIDGDITDKVVKTITNIDGEKVESIDNTKAGEFIIHYNVTDEAGNVASEVTRKVIIEQISYEDAVNITVDNNKVKISIESEYIKETVTVRIVNDETGEIAYLAEEISVDNKVEFNTVINTSGEYTVYLNAINGAPIIEEKISVEVVDINKPTIYLQGNPEITLYVGEEYVEPGFVANDKEDGRIDENVEITITDGEGNLVENVDTSKVGTFTIHYNVKDAAGNEAEEVTRTVIVNNKPVDENLANIVIDNNNVTVTVESEDIKDVVTISIVDDATDTEVFDDEQASVNNKVEFNAVINASGSYTAYINAIKGSEIIEKKFVLDVKDLNKPTITLLGDNEITLFQGDEYVEPGFTAEDEEDGNIEGEVVITTTDVDGNLVENGDTSKVGTFTIHYNVKDAAGNEADEVTRKLIVKEEEHQAEGITIEVNGHEIDVTVVHEQLSDEITFRIEDSKGATVRVGAEDVIDGKVHFTRKIRDIGTYTLIVEGLENGEILTKDFEIKDGGSGETNNIPEINLNGESTVILKLNEDYVESGATAWDEEDKDISNSIEIIVTNEQGEECELDTSVEGTYSVRYNVKDSDGNSANEVIRTVIVQDDSQQQDGPVNIEVIGNQINVVLEHELLDFEITYKILNSKGSVILTGQEDVVDKKVSFTRKIREAGTYTLVIQGLTNNEVLECEFVIETTAN